MLMDDYLIGFIDIYIGIYRDCSGILGNNERYPMVI